MAGEKGRFLDDKESLDALIEQMDPREHGEYLAYGALGKEAAFPNRKLIVYTLRSGLPDNVSILNMGYLTVTRDGGPVVEISDTEHTQNVSVTPSRWRDRDLFLQIPQHFEFKWTGKDAGDRGVQFVPLYALLIKARSKEFHQVEGHTYCVTLNRFRERFPEYPIRY